VREADLCVQNVHEDDLCVQNAREDDLCTQICQKWACVVSVFNKYRMTKATRDRLLNMCV